MAEAAAVCLFFRLPFTQPYRTVRACVDALQAQSKTGEPYGPPVHFSFWMI
jgi:hypothetical protein